MRWVLAGLALVGCGQARAPAPAPACASCHVEEARTWEASLHHRAFTDPDFASAFAHEPEPFCVGCHAPTAASKEDPRVAEGVTCRSCHVEARDSGDGRGLHPVGAARSCASCHDFADPRGQLALQKTAREHARSRFAAASCASCHLSARDHSFAASRDLDRLRDAVSLDVRADATTLDVTVRPIHVGHAFPTGDLFRRVRVFAYRETLDGRVIASAERAFERSFEPGAGPRIEHADGRLTGETTFTLDLAAKNAGNEPTRATVQLVYERGAGRAGDELTLFSSAVLHERTLELR